jgi:hypothetical protein
MSLAARLHGTNGKDKGGKVQAFEGVVNGHAGG